MIKVYTNTGCGACKTVKTILEGNGLIEGEHFQYINIDEDEQASVYVKENYMSVPVTEYKDDVSLGVEPDMLNRFIQAVQ